VTPATIIRLAWLYRQAAQAAKGEYDGCGCGQPDCPDSDGEVAAQARCEAHSDTAKCPRCSPTEGGDTLQARGETKH
jgi:hypothetical protein